MMPKQPGKPECHCLSPCLGEFSRRDVALTSKSCRRAQAALCPMPQSFNEQSHHVLLRLFHMLPPFPALPQQVLCSLPAGPLPQYLLKRGPVFQMLVLPTQPRGGSVIFSFSNKSCTAWATTATASLMWADSFLPLMSCRPITPAAGTGEAGQHCRHHRLLRAQRLGTASTRLRAEDPLDAVGSSLSFRQVQRGWAGSVLLGTAPSTTDTLSSIPTAQASPRVTAKPQGHGFGARQRGQGCVPMQATGAEGRVRDPPFGTTTAPRSPSPRGPGEGSTRLLRAWLRREGAREVPTIGGVAQGIARDLPLPHQPHVAGARHVEHGR